MKKRIMEILVVMVMVISCFVGCGKKDGQQKEVDKTVQGESADEQAKSDVAILTVSFGTSYNDSRDITIGAIESAIADAFPQYEVRRAFTSQIIIDVLKEREGLEIDNVEQALERAVEDGIKELIVQPTHLMNGFEYNDLAEILTKYVDKFDKIVLGDPLLTSDSDFDAVIQAITESTESYDDGETAICFMGHGTEAESNEVYAKLQDKLTQAGYENYYVGTVEASPSLDDVITALKTKGTYKKVILQPLMVVAGDHANNDMAGTEKDSWKTILENEGYEVTCIIKGLGQMESIQAVYVEHLKKAISSGEAFKGIVEEQQTNENEKVGVGTYLVEVESSSSMFKIDKAELVVAEDGSMTAVMSMSGTGYTKLYMGTGEQAANADETEYIDFVEDADGVYTFTIPVAALDQPIDCAAFSKKKKKWYDRQITFLSSSLSTVRSAESTSAENTDVSTVDVKDGTYKIDISFSGGSGKAEILSPAIIKIEGDTKIATVQWNSENYDYMLVGNEKFLPISTEGGSVFEIPVTVFDEEMTIIGDTIAMSKPREIEYTITFHSETMKPVE